MDPGRHASDQQLEDYVHGRLDEGETHAVESHLAGCAQCLSRLAETVKFFLKLSTLKLEDGRAAREKRREPRFSTEGSATVKLLDPLNLEGSPVEIINVSRSGLKLRSHRRLTVGSIVQVRLKDTFILGEVRYCKPCSEDFCAGVQIYDVVQ